MADVAKLYQEARELPVRQHNDLISQQYAIACLLPQHPCHRPPDDRLERRRSLIGQFKPNIQQYLAEDPLSNTSYKSAISSIHQYEVRTVIESSSSKTAQWPTAAHCYSRTDTAKEDKNNTGTTTHRSQPNPWSVHE